MMRSLVLIVALLLAGCATTREARPPALTTIEYETGACFGACPVYTLRVAGDGKGVFTGKRYTAVSGEQAFTATPAQVAAFAAALKPYRPRGERSLTPGTPGCERVATDQPSIKVRWTGGKQGEDLLSFYLGCNMEGNGPMADALLAAPETLPVTRFIDKR